MIPTQTLCCESVHEAPLLLLVVVVILHPITCCDALCTLPSCWREDNRGLCHSKRPHSVWVVVPTCFEVHYHPHTMSSGAPDPKTTQHICYALGTGHAC